MTLQVKAFQAIFAQNASDLLLLTSDLNSDHFPRLFDHEQAVAVAEICIVQHHQTFIRTMQTMRKLQLIMAMLLGLAAQYSATAQFVYSMFAAVV
jgi:hypothetical protein